MLWVSTTDHPTRMKTPMNYMYASTPGSAALVLMRDCNLPVINWEYHTAGANRSRSFLKHLDDTFLV